MSTVLYSNDILSPSIANLRWFIENQFDHSWLVRKLPAQLFSELDMQELRLELIDMASFGTRPAQMEYTLEKLDKLCKALSRLNISELRRELGGKRDRSIHKELVINTLEVNTQRLRDSILNLRERS